MENAKYNNLTVIEKDGDKWLCRCDCGNTIIKRKYNVISGHTKSCGCLRSKSCISRNKQLKGTRNTKYGCLFGAVKKSYKSKSVEYDLPDDDLYRLLKSNCFYCGREPSNEKQDTLKKHLGTFIYNGVDRVDNSLGYTIDNSVPCCKRCNVAKNNMSHNEFIDLCRKIVERDDERIEEGFMKAQSKLG